MSGDDGGDPSSIEPTSDPCSRCGRPVARVPLLYIGMDRADLGSSKVYCSTCLNRRGWGRKIGSVVGGASNLFEFGQAIYWIAVPIIGLTLGSLMWLFGRR